MAYWIIQHDLASFDERSDVIGMPEAKAKKDRFRQIRDEDKIIYYAKKNTALGIYEVTGIWKRLKSWSPSRRGAHMVYQIKPIFPQISELKLSNFGIKSTRGQTAIPLTMKQYAGIKDRILGMTDPVDHDSALALFAKIHAALGYQSLKVVQRDYPDITALDSNQNEVRIELEFQSHTFEREHIGQPDNCDVIVCWEDTWGQAATKPIKAMKDVLY